MILLLISAVICLLMVIASTLFMIRKQPQKLAGELFRMSETVYTAIMGGMLIAMGFFIIITKYIDPNIAGNEPNSYLFVGVFAVVCVAGGCEIMFYTFLQKVIACEDKLVFVSIIGGIKELYWNEIIETKTGFMTNKVTLVGKTSKFTVGGEPKKYKEFLLLAKRKIRPEVGSDVLQNLLNRSMG